jgi:CRP/FNR family transcriptional regulator, transcriptional activator FtrB
LRADDLPVLRGLDLFSGMADENFTDLVKGAFLQHFPTHVELIHEGDPADFLYVVIEGRVELYAEANGRETTVELISPVSTFILAAVLRDSVYLASARTMEKSRLLMIPAKNILEAMERDDAFGRAVVSALAVDYRTMLKALKDQKLRTAVERLANYLLRLEQVQGANGKVTLDIDKRLLASRLGMTPENISRAFSTLGAYGVVVKGPHITLQNRSDLEILAKPTPLIDDETT